MNTIGILQAVAIIMATMIGIGLVKGWIQDKRDEKRLRNKIEAHEHPVMILMDTWKADEPNGLSITEEFKRFYVNADSMLAHLVMPAIRAYALEEAHKDNPTEENLKRKEEASHDYMTMLGKTLGELNDYLQKNIEDEKRVADIATFGLCALKNRVQAVWCGDMTMNEGITPLDL